jgi:hypothetical protein
MKEKNINKFITFMVLLLLFVSCSKPELQYFSNMAEYPYFNNIKDKTVLRGIDRTRIIQNRHGNYFLSTPDDALFNIDGELLLKDSIVYIKTKNIKNKDTIQILFNFKQTEYQKYPSDTIPYGRSYSYLLSDKNKVLYVAMTTYYCSYLRNKLSYYMDITNMGSHYDSDICDFVTDFLIEKSKIGESWIDSKFHLFISLKLGFVNLIYWNKNYTYSIDILNQKLSYKK